MSACVPNVSESRDKLTDVLSKELEDVTTVAGLRHLHDELTNLFHTVHIRQKSSRHTLNSIRLSLQALTTDLATPQADFHWASGHAMIAVSDWSLVLYLLRKLRLL